MADTQIMGVVVPLQGANAAEEANVHRVQAAIEALTSRPEHDCDAVAELTRLRERLAAVEGERDDAVAARDAAYKDSDAACRDATEARARCVELEGMANEDQSAFDHVVGERDAARKDLETSVTVLWAVWPLVTGPGVDPGHLLGILNENGAKDSPMRQACRFLAAHPVKPSGT